MFQNVDEALRYIRDRKVVMVDLKTADLIGRWRHMVYKTGHDDEKIFTKGTGTSLTSYPGFKTMECGDMMIRPDPGTAFMYPFAELPTLCLICDIFNNDGTPFDLEAIGARARAVGAALVVDGTQSVGAMPFDVQRLQPDALVCAAYKWLMGPWKDSPQTSQRKTTGILSTRSSAPSASVPLLR